MSDETTKYREGIEWLTVILAIVVIIALGLLYFFWKPSAENRMGELIIAIIPSAIIVLIAIPIVYFIFTKKGLDNTTTQIDENRLAELVVAKIAAHNNGSSPVIAFHETFRHVEWEALLASTHLSIDIVVYYFDSWVNANYDSLRKFFSRPMSRMRVFVADPRSNEIVNNVARLFPEYTPEVVREKIARTGDRLAQAIRESGGDPSRLEFYYVPHLLNYSIQSLDDKVLILSIFEMFRRNRIDSPAIVLDLTRSEHLARYWHKEREGLLRISEKIEVRI